ncbi:6-phosphofructokinase [Neoactinobaculum massilliense]|uniref:6-phosphofructokinase n=1 Tax=Neoactinobaculum massilliense TaxID=2364794 RepID=UPI000F51EB1B|nr:6-phosphofructokinase [Neoactinobaculum massilliense]
MSEQLNIGVLTSGGDAPGMNAVVRAVVRTSLHAGAVPYTIHEGWRGVMEGGDAIVRAGWSDVSSVLGRGGTVIGTARSAEFRERSGRQRAALNLVRRGIDRLVVVGGDGSLTGADTLAREWRDHLTDLLAQGAISSDDAAAHPSLHIAGIVGSIDNDLVGSSMTVGTDSALHRIMDATDAIASTAASHQRTFIVEVMGRRCGYLALTAALGSAADEVFIPELPPEDGWEDAVVAKIRAAHAAGRRDSIIIVAEGCQDRHGTPLTAARIQQAIAERVGEAPRITALGHVQRGGTPSAYDRWMSSALGHTATLEVLAAGPGDDSYIFGTRAEQIVRLPLAEAVANTQAVGTHLERGDYAASLAARGPHFAHKLELFHRLSTPLTDSPARRRRRVAIVHVGGLAPGMNTAARTAVQLGEALGLEMVGVRGGFPGLVDGDIVPLSWRSVDKWGNAGGAALGTRRTVPDTGELFGIARTLEERRIDGLIMIGGLAGYEGILSLAQERLHYPAFNIPMVCIPTSIDNNLPNNDFSIGADTALNTNVEAIDRVKESASASNRCFVVETMGRNCGFLALLSGISTGAEQVYLQETGMSLAQLSDDAASMVASFRGKRSLYLVIRNEQANENLTTDLITRLFEEAGHGLFDARSAVIGHQQQGGEPSPFDRDLAIRLVDAALTDLTGQFRDGTRDARYIGSQDGDIRSYPIRHFDEQMDMATRLPLRQWWLGLRDLLYTLARNTSAEPSLLSLYQR